jgi:Coenzyme PQQ synthesis protein D (PqqD)
MTKTALTLQSVVAQSPDLVGSKIEEHTALLSITNGAYYNLNPVASRVWQLIEQPCAAAVVVEQLLTEYAVERTQCEAQTLAFLQQLADAGLLTVQ